MKKLILLFLMFASNAFGAITDGKFGINQIFDVQYWWNGTTLNASNFIAPYNKNFQTVTVTAGQYFQFFPSTTNPGKYGLKLMNSNGTQHSIVHDYGDITALGSGAIFYIGSGFFGNVITTSQGYSYGASATFTNMDTSVDSNDLNNYTWASTTPLASGQTAAPTPPPPAPTPIYFNNATVRITNIWPTSNNSPAGEGAANAFDNNPNTKYLNFDKQNAGVTVKLNTGRVVNGFTITTANDFPGRDPTSYKLYGSNDGVTWVLIQEGSLSLSDNRFTTSGMINITNSAAYAYYYIMFPTTKAGTGCGLNCDSMQIAEITYYYDANNSTTSSASGGTSAPVDPVQAAAGPTVQGGTITQTNAPNNQIIQSGTGYSSNTDSTAQASRITTWANTAQPYNNAVHVTQVGGDDNTVTISLTGSKNRVELTLGGIGDHSANITQVGSNYLKAEITGYQNNLTTSQTNTIGTNYAETTINGNNNTVNHTQSNNNNRLLFSTVNGNNNTLSTTQSGGGQHYLDVRMTGNGHNVLVNQYGANANNARIDVTNAGGASTVDLEQAGGKNFTLIQSCTNPLGCSTVVRQQ